MSTRLAKTSDARYLATSITQSLEMASNGVSGAIKVPILGKESIIVDYGLWQNFVANDILRSIPSSTYVLICDTNIAKLEYVPLFKTRFEAERDSLGKHPEETRLLVYDRVKPGETSKSRRTKAEIEDWLLKQGCTRDCDIGSGRRRDGRPYRIRGSYLYEGRALLPNSNIVTCYGG